MIEIVLLGAPRGKGRPRFRVVADAYASTYTDAKTRKYEDDLRKVAAAAMVGRAVLDEPLSVVVEAHMPVPESWSRVKRAKALAGELMPTGKPDCDNIIKGVDAFNAVVWRDDSLIVRLEFLKFYSASPKLVVRISPWND